MFLFVLKRLISSREGGTWYQWAQAQIPGIILGGCDVARVFVTHKHLMNPSIPQVLKFMFSIKPSAGYEKTLLSTAFCFRNDFFVLLSKEKFCFPVSRAAVLLVLGVHLAAPWPLLPRFFLSSYGWETVKDVTAGSSYDNKSLVGSEVWIWTWIARVFLFEQRMQLRIGK